MSKLSETVIEPLIVTEDDSELAQVIRVGTDNVLTRLPIHRLAKQGAVKIAIENHGLRGSTVTKWKVSPSRDFGEPGPLAYDFDTLILNKLIDEFRPEIPRLFKIADSLNQLNEMLGKKGTRDTDKLKRAILQNVGTIIHADIHYKGKDGAERDFEFAASRYSVIFVGEKLPGGKKSEAIYVLLNELYMEHLRRSNTRPLDYNYICQLTPAPRRFYELISPEFYGAINHGNREANYLYSELCTFAPLTRHTDIKKMHSQMAKIHNPHIDSDYISKINFERVTDGKGRPDWLIRYTPGKRAFREYRAFVPNRSVKRLPPKPRLLELPLPAPQKATREQEPLVELLINHGVDETRAIQLVERDFAECELWAAAWPYQNQKGMENPAGVLISFIEKKRRPLPAGYRKAREIEDRGRVKAARRKEEQDRADHESKFLAIYRASYLWPQIEKIRSGKTEAAKALRKMLKTWEANSADKPHAEDLKAAVISALIEKHPEIEILDFWQWDQSMNPTPFDFGKE